MRSMSVRAGITTILAVAGLAISGPAQATSESASWKLKGGDTFQVNAWHCAAYLKSCSWKTSTKLLGNNPFNAIWIENRAELRAHGLNASLKISKRPSATLTMKSKSLGVVRWRNTRDWIADNSGKMNPSWTTVYVSTRSCGSAQVTPKIFVSEKCVYAGAF